MAQPDSLEIPRLRRLLSLEYYYKGKLTSVDPSYGSSCEEKREEEDALLRGLPETGYSSGVVRARTKIIRQSGFFSPYNNGGDVLSALTNPVIVSSYLAFKSLGYFFETIGHLIDMANDGFVALYSLPFEEQEQSISMTRMNLVMFNFLNLRSALVSGVIAALMGALSLVDGVTRLCTRTISTLVQAVMDPVEKECSYDLSF